MVRNGEGADDRYMFDPHRPFELIPPLLLLVIVTALSVGVTTTAIGGWLAGWADWVFGL